MTHRKLLRKVLAAPDNTRFGDMVTLVKAFRFQLLRTAGSHHIFGRDGIEEQINLQKVGGKAKAYQIRQFFRIVERYNLQLEGEDDE